MFDTMLVKAVKPKSVSWRNPDILDLDLNDENGLQSYTLLKGAQDYLYKKIDLKYSTSKEVYKKSSDIWRSLINCQLDNAKDKCDNRQVFSLDKNSVVYLIDSNRNIVDMYDTINEEQYNELQSSIEKYMIDITTIDAAKKFFADGKGGIVKLVCYDKNADLPNMEYTPICIIEYNTKKSLYEVYYGVLIYSSFTFICNFDRIVSVDDCHSFMFSFDLKKWLTLAEEKADYLYDSYQNALQNSSEISVRELMLLFKQIGYKLQLKSDTDIGEIKNLSDETNNARIQEFFNTFKFTTGETGCQVVNLSELKKIFRYNKLTWLDVLDILSKEYLTFDGAKISCEMLSSIFDMICSRKVDNEQVKAIEKELD